MGNAFFTNLTSAPNVGIKKATVNDGTGLVTILNGSGNRISTSEGNTNSKVTQKLTVKALPNPSSTYFTLIIQSNQNQLISLRVYDILGRAIETRYNIPTNSFSIGHQYKAGLYYVEITQGNEKQTIKIIKSDKY